MSFPTRFSPPAVALPVLFVLAAALFITVPARTSESEAPSANLGTVEFPTSGSPEAQELFLQGMAALHSFFYDEAADLFREAQVVDPDFALAYWGEAMTHNHPLWNEQDREAARAVLERLAPSAEERAAKAPTAREKAYLQVAEILYGEGDKRPRDLAVEQAWRRLAEAYPEDDEAALFHALSLQGIVERGAGHKRLEMRSAAIAEEVFARRPTHPGAAHYLIHAYDDPTHAPLGLRSARVYAEVAPAAPHALHMPSHIFVQLGLWPEAERSNAGAYAASVAWVERRGHPISKRDFHSYAWRHYALLQLGRWQEAAEQVAEVEELFATDGTDDPWLRWTADMMAARQMLETERWQPMDVPEEVTDRGYRGGEAARIFAAGLSAAHRGEEASARRAWELLQQLVEDAGESWETGDLEIYRDELEGVARLLLGDKEIGLAALARAADREAERGAPHGPPMPMIPAQELYGRELLRLGRADEAVAPLEAALVRTPNRSFLVLARAQAAAATGDETEARHRYRQLVANWTQSDEGLAGVSGLDEAREYLAAHPSPESSEASALASVGAGE